MNDNNIENELVKRGFEKSLFGSNYVKNIKKIKMLLLPSNDTFIITISKFDIHNNFLALPAVRTTQNLKFEELDEIIQFFS